MRQLAYSNAFDVAINLFTSFGYFKTNEEHVSSLLKFRNALKQGGLLILDYFNCHKILQKLIPEEIKQVGSIDFHIQKEIAGNKLIKTIDFDDKHRSHTFTEMVSIFTVDDFMRFFQQSGFEIISNFGSYGLEKFDVDQSDRLIFICKRTDA